MICYPDSFSVLSADEIAYTQGGASAASLSLTAAGVVVSIINSANVISIEMNLLKKNPDYDTSLLAMDAYNIYMERPYGKLMMVTGVVLGVTGLVFTFASL